MAGGSQAQNIVKFEVLLHSWHCPASTWNRMYFQVLVNIRSCFFLGWSAVSCGTHEPGHLCSGHGKFPLTHASGCRVAGQWCGSLFPPLKCLQFSVFKKKLQVLTVVLASLSDNLDIEKSFALLCFLKESVIYLTI